jgi:Tol biopolymer transport system component
MWAVPVQNAQTAGDPFLVQADFGNKSKKMTRSGRLVYNTSVEMTDVYALDIDRVTGESPGIPKLITTSHYGKHESPAWSPDGKKIAYVRNANLLCVRSLEDGREECAESGMAWISWVSWSPDGRSVALSSVGGLPTKTGVRIYSAQTGTVSTLFEVERPLFSPLGWSANSKELLWIRYVVKDATKPPLEQETTHELVATDVATKEERILDARLNSGWNFGAVMQLSPDRTRIAYVLSDGVKKEVSIVVHDLKDRQRRAVVTLSEDKAYLLSPVWSPDGRMIEFHVVDRTTKPTTTTVRVVAADGSWEKKIGTGKLQVVGRRSQDAWSPDGTKLAVTLSGGPTQELWAMENFLPPAKPTAK